MFHASIGQAEVHEFLMSRAEPLVLVYHNVTPGEYFAPYDLVFADLLELGRREVESLRPRVVRARSPTRTTTRASSRRWATATFGWCRPCSMPAPARAA